MPKTERFLIEGTEYESKSSLVQGGSAAVWKVGRKSGDDVFAVKRIMKDPKQDSVRNRRFVQEIKYGQATRHPNVVRIHACSEDEDFYYYVMDFYPMTLRDVIDKESDPDVLLDYTRQLCEAIAHVHNDGIVHRDIKPENILVDPVLNRLVLADFGIAHFKESTLTKRGDLLVNRNYLAPEQMVKNNAHDVGKPADIFALGLVITEMFTKQNPRGKRHALVRDRYPYLADLDPIVEQMMVQVEAQRLPIENVRGLLRVLVQRLDMTIGAIADEIRPNQAPAGASFEEVERAIDRATRDLLSAKHIFERVTDDDLRRYNVNYHCEISWRASPELLNTCAQAVAYSMCKAKFEYEAAGAWDEYDDSLVSSEAKESLVRDFDDILADFPISDLSLWDGLPRQSAHFFRFCKDYHCEELLASVRAVLYSEGSGGLRANLLDAPIFWVIRSVRDYLNSGHLSLDQAVREEVEVERHLVVLWNETLPIDRVREATGAELFFEPFDTNDISRAIAALELKWDVSVGELASGNYSVVFKSRDGYKSFRDQAVASAEPGSAYEADVLNLLRPEVECDDLVALTWDRDFDIAVTLGKVLGTRTR